MSSRDQRRAALPEKLQRLRAVTGSRAVNKASVIVDALAYIRDLKGRVESFEQERDQNLPMEVNVETLDRGFRINVYSERSCPGLLVSILKAFEELRLNVQDARVSCSDNFSLEAIGVEDEEDEIIDAQVVKQAVLQAVRNWSEEQKGYCHRMTTGNVSEAVGWDKVRLLTFSFDSLNEKNYKSLNKITRTLRFIAPFPMLAYPFYLWTRSPGKSGSNFHPDSELFQPSERKDVITSTLCWAAMASLILGLSFVMAPIQLLKLYGIPYWIFVMWLDFVTYLHHHDHQDKLPWYRGEEWSYLRGGLTTLDRDYGWINNIHHDIRSHAIHHLFPQIPRYHLIEALKAAKPVIGKYYKEPKRSGPLPIYSIGRLITNLRNDHFVSDTGDVVYYQTNHCRLWNSGSSESPSLI